MRKGIVVEMDDSYLTLLTPDGEFLRAIKQDKIYALGEEIHFFPIAETIETNKAYSLKNLLKSRSVWISVAALLVCLGSIFPVYQSNKAYAYMSIDADPSIELGLNKKLQVVELTGFNKDAENIISQLEDWKKKDVTELTKIILTQMNKEGFINNKEPVTITTVRPKNGEKSVETKLKKNIEEIKQVVKNQKLKIKMYTTSEEDVQKARGLGVTSGKYQQEKIEKQQDNEKSNSSQTENKLENISNSSPAQNSLESLKLPGQVEKEIEKDSSKNNGEALNKGTNGEQGSSEKKSSPSKYNGKELNIETNDGQGSSVPGHLKKIDNEKKDNIQQKNNPENKISAENNKSKNEKSNSENKKNK